MKRLLVLMILSVAFGMVVHAQHASFYLNVTQPVGSFASSASLHDIPGYPAMTRTEIGTDAITGIGGSYRYSFRFDLNIGSARGEVLPSLEAGFYWNRIRKDHRNAYEELRAKSPNYFNIPLMVNVTYRYVMSENVKPFAEFGLGYDLLFISREGREDEQNDFRYSAAGGMAWQFGAGVLLSDQFSIGIHLYSFGRHGVDYKSSTDDPVGKTLAYLNGDDLSKAKFSNYNTLMLRLGFHF